MSRQPSPDSYAFESELRRSCDAAYLRPSARDNPMRELVEGRLPIAEARRFWAGRWTRVLVLNQHILPALLRTCPDLESRANLWRSISVEYGEGKYERSHPVLYTRFLKALGLAEDPHYPSKLPDDPETRRLVLAVENASWLELLGAFLARETVGPKVFGIIADALRASYGLSDADVEWFTVHAVGDLDDANDIFDLARQFGTNPEARERIRAAMLAWFDANSEYCCALGPIPIHYAGLDGHA
ncbi:iron-containing redox enzyme family protein [Pendulispora brunnea]|uniref:Iron-containing redox enzyme family protein n=1 Tax=Pendulispora brunnea TaxID=2905690 RepID=A0ABZ2K257_9BACT